MSNVNEQVKREEKDVESPSHKPTVSPGEKGTGILHD